ncbi:A-kinase anchor protein 8-like isoform X2 [Dendropsophus ebraccatus]|uniref:A-kinase anchor protein 8-like isoform X2 n=1 Tax=Dendropsophus ebraccatus TaxID=150705 RepID=UPI00383149F1
MDTGLWSRSMYGRSRYPRGGRAPEMDGRDSNNHAYMDYGREPYRSSSQSWISSYDTVNRERFETEYSEVRSSPLNSNYDRPKRSRYEYAEPAGGYGRQRGRWSPRGGQSGWRGREESYKGNFRSSPPRYRRPDPDLFPELRTYYDLKVVTENYYLGGGFKRKSDFIKKVKNKVYKEEEPAVEKMKTTTESNKPEESGSEGDGNAEEAAQSTTTGGNQKDGRREESEHAQSSSKSQQETQIITIGERTGLRIQFFCSICQFRTFYEERMNKHMQSSFHKKHFDYLGKNLSKEAAAFLQEHVSLKSKKTERHRSLLPDLTNTIHRMLQNQDLTLELDSEHFVRKVEVAACAACNILIPMLPNSLEQHIRSSSHKKKRKIMMGKSKNRAMYFAKMTLCGKQLNQKAEQYINDQNPFIKNEEEETTRGGCSADLPYITLSDSEGEEEEDSGGQVTGQENAEESSTVCDRSESAEVDVYDE